MLFCQSPVSKNIITADTVYTIYSKITSRDYQLFIFLPNSYSTKDSISYPVLFVLDGLRDLKKLGQINENLSGKIEEVVIVGISSGAESDFWVNRQLDYTTSYYKKREKQNRKKYNLPKEAISTGGASEFLKCLKTEITPFLNKHYKLNSDRGITGHSLAGLFTSYTLVNSTGFFNRYGINSPSFWWDDKKFLEQSASQLVNKNWDSKSKRIFLSVGGKEPKHMITNTVKFKSNLELVKSENLIIIWSLFENETHGSAIGVSLNQTLLELYGINRAN